MVYGFTGSFIATGLATAASHFPDIFELGGVVEHRTITHWPYLYLVPASLLLAALNGTSPHLWQYILIFLFVGCLAHLVEDFMSMGGIPLGVPYGPKYGLKLYVTHQSTESLTVMLICASFLLLALARGYFSGEYISGEMIRASKTLAAAGIHFARGGN